MNSEKEQALGDDAYLSNFEASDRRRKVILISAGIVLTILVILGFLLTLGSLGKLGQDVGGVFHDQGKIQAESAPDAEAAPSVTASAPESPAAESAAHESAAPAVNESEPAPAETNPAP
jgi:hypothetical protein